ncbi:MAG: hypothetical protein ACW99G_11425 [Candidatus Thorarchaeota archaeon]|jgi:hypothetical protein
MDKDELINKLAELRDEMIEVKRADVAVILSYIIAAVHEDMAEQGESTYAWTTGERSISPHRVGEVRRYIQWHSMVV